MSPTPPPAIPSPMNATTHHPKTHISLAFPSTIFPASQPITGKLTLESRASQGLGLGVIMVELFGIQQLSSRDHHATNVFLKERRVFQGLGFGASNAVDGPPWEGKGEYWTSKKGISTFLFSLPLPRDAPNAIVFGDGVASVRYLMRASVEVCWKGERKVVVGDRFVDVVEGFDERALRYGMGEGGEGEGGVVVGENGKIWIQARVVGGVIVSGESACVELQVKNHSNKKNSSLTITLTRHLVLPPTSPSASTPKLELSDTLTSIPFKGPEYVIHPGIEGVASLVFDVPRHARGVVKGGLFEIKCILSVKMGMGIGSKDITLDIPVPVVHPAALPELPPEEVYYNDYYAPPPNPYAPPPHSYPAIPTSPQPHLYPLPTSPQPYPLSYTVDPTQGVVYLPPLSPQPQPHYAPPPQQAYYDPNAHINGYYPAPPPQPQQPPPPPPVTGLPPTGGVRDVSDVPTSSEQQQPKQREAPAWVRSPPVQDPPPQVQNTKSTSPMSLSIALPPPLSPQSQSQSLGTPLHSPRPLLSPKRSSDKLRSERVEVLERIAAAEGEVKVAKEEDYFGSVLPPAVPSKTLDVEPKPEPTSLPNHAKQPPSPVPVPVPAATKTKASPPSPKPPATTTTTKHQHQLALRPPRESGLDALEKRLLDHVGTRKPEQEGKKDLWSVFSGGLASQENKERRNSYHSPSNQQPTPSPKHEPSPSPRRNSYNHSPSPRRERESEPMDIPAPRQAPTNESDSLSAISSLTLPDCELLSPPVARQNPNLGIGDLGLGLSLGLDEKKGEKEVGDEEDSDNDIDNKTTKSGKSGKTATGTGARSRKKREKEKEKERVRESRESEKKEKKGRRNERVQAWLSGVGAGVEVDGMELEGEPETGKVDGLPLSHSHSKSREKETDASPQPTPQLEKRKPDPRSSGFVPLGTLKPDILQRTLVPKDSPMACGESLVEDARRVQELWGAPGSLHNASSTGAPDKVSSFSGDKDNKDEKGKEKEDNPWKTLLSRRNLMLGIPETGTKYDVRSARGGKGGQVTAVKMIWDRVGEEEEEPGARKVSSSSRKTSVEKDMKNSKPITRKSFDSATPTPKPLKSPTKLISSKSSSGSGSTTPPPKPNPKPKPKPRLTSTSKPTLSSSHAQAVPTISSTASLARPVTSLSSAASSTSVGKEGAPPPRISHSLPELGQGKGQGKEKGKEKVGGLKAIVEGGSAGGGAGAGVNGVVGGGGAEKVGVGQARLRDLIRKYQGGA